MNKPQVIMFLIAVVVGMVAPTHAEFCAVQLSTTYPDNELVVRGRAELLSSTGELVASAEIRNGRAEFCDFGFGEYSIRVSSDRTLPVVIHAVRLRYGSSQKLRVVLNLNPDSPGDRGPTVGTACSVYARVIALDGKPIDGVRITYGGFTSVTDGYGRAVFLVPLNQFANLRFEKAGMQRSQSMFSCSDPSEHFERTIVLSSQAK